MASTTAETSSPSGTTPAKNDRRPRAGSHSGGGHASAPETRLDEHVDRPSTMAPGDAPHDTTDPDERATSVSPDKAAAARAGHQTVNAVVPRVEPDVLPDQVEREDRVETVETVGPDGQTVRVRRNLDTGESERL